MSARTILTLANGKDVELSALCGMGLVYLGTPYTKFPDGIEAAFIAAAQITAALLRRGVKVYSPIAHTHPVAVYGRIDPLDLSIWLPFDEAMMARSDALLVAQMESWEISKGLAHEVDYFLTHDKPVLYLDPKMLMVRP